MLIQLVLMHDRYCMTGVVFGVPLKVNTKTTVVFVFGNPGSCTQTRKNHRVVIFLVGAKLAKNTTSTW